MKIKIGTLFKLSMGKNAHTLVHVQIQLICLINEIIPFLWMHGSHWRLSDGISDLILTDDYKYSGQAPG